MTLASLSRVPGLGDAASARFYNACAPRDISPKIGIDRSSTAADYAGAYLVKRGLFLPDELPAILAARLAREGLAPPRAAASSSRARDHARSRQRRSRAWPHSNRRYYLGDQLLRDIDWASMAHSLEVRVPLVDAHLLMKIAPVIVAAHDYEKKLLTAAPAAPLPPEILHRPKTGFLLPIREWIKPEAGSPHTFGMRSLAMMLDGVAVVRMMDHRSMRSPLLDVVSPDHG